MTWLLIVAAVLFALLLFSTRYSYVEGFAAALLPSDPTGPAGLPSDPPPTRVDARCKNYGFTMPPGTPGADDSTRYYTKSGCQSLGGTWDPNTYTCLAGSINYSSMCAGLPYTTPAPDECFPKGDRTQILGQPNGLIQNNPQLTGVYRVYTTQECQQLGGTTTPIPELPGFNLCMVDSNQLHLACANLNYRDPGCKNYGFSMNPIIAGKTPTRGYTKSGCDGVGGIFTNGLCVRANEGGEMWNRLCAGLDNKTPAPDECFPGGDRTKILGVPSPYVATLGPDWTGNMRFHTAQECQQLGGTTIPVDGLPNLYACMVNAAPLHMACAPLNFQPAAAPAAATATAAAAAPAAAAPAAATAAAAAPLSPTVAAALAPGTPSTAATAASCPVPAPCPQPSAAQCPSCPSPVPCPASPPCPTPPICPPPPPVPDCPRYDKTTAWNNR